MHRRQRPSLALQRAAELQQAARVRRHDGVRPRRQDVSRLAPPQLVRRLGLHQVVDAGRTAAQPALRHVQHLQPGNGRQHLARRVAHPLRVLQVTGVVIGDAHPHGTARRPRLQAGQHLRDVAALGGQGPGARRVGRVVPQQAPVFLQRRAAAGRVDHDRVDVGQRRFEGVDEAPRQRLGFAFEAGVHHQRAAAALPRRDHHLAALGREHARRGGVDAAEEDPLHATEQQGHAPPPLPPRGDHGRQRRPDAVERDRRGHRLQGAQASRQQVRQSAGAHQPLESEALPGPQLRGHPAQAAGIGEEREDQPAEQPVSERPLDVTLDLRTRRLHQLVVAHAGRTRGQARHAAEAGVEVPRELRRDPRLAFQGHLQQVNPPARRIGLAAPQRVGRARRQTEAAVDAVGEQVGRGRTVRVEGAGVREHVRPWYRNGGAGGARPGAAQPERNGAGLERPRTTPCPGRPRGRTRRRRRDPR